MTQKYFSISYWFSRNPLLFTLNESVADELEHITEKLEEEEKAKEEEKTKKEEKTKEEEKTKKEKKTKKEEKTKKEGKAKEEEKTKKEGKTKKDDSKQPQISSSVEPGLIYRAIFNNALNSEKEKLDQKKGSLVNNIDRYYFKAKNSPFMSGIIQQLTRIRSSLTNRLPTKEVLEKGEQDLEQLM